MIRERVPADLPRCVDLLAQTHAHEGFPMNWPDDPAAWLTPPGMVCAWLAVSASEEILGHIMVRARLETTQPAILSRLFVSPAARGQGLGATLLGVVTRWAVDNGRPLRLEVDSGRSAAIRLYERQGFARTGSYVADWTAPDGRPVTMINYATPVA